MHFSGAQSPDWTNDDNLVMQSANNSRRSRDLVPFSFSSECNSGERAHLSRR